MTGAGETLAARLMRGCPDIDLREETDDDIAFLAGLYASTRTEELAPVPWPDAAKQAFLRSQFEQQRAHYRRHYNGAEFLLVRAGSERIGRLYCRRSGNEYRLMDIALLPDWRGRGVGGQMIRTLLDCAASDRCEVTLHVEPGNPARRMYERLGFRLIEDRGVYWFLGWTKEAPADQLNVIS
ncbi:GNAT family N-acetyltransferase [Tahibacter amnicola]|uniref:GNAT family N-acetyltransferase n=1 Tax=Tahibacter amnicola TaxID=2976241 RepID=A0ABY6BLM1_9GAMM|nr:GNAT family N-acetyltransferase [Tahibacter amnicola]UXI69280.1 GNAT family N-acetyltransferase [Tahibacter amnicola]